MFDRNSDTWITLKREIAFRIEKLRTDLEQPGMDPEGLRGEILGLRWVIKQVEPDRPIAFAATDYMQAHDPS